LLPASARVQVPAINRAGEQAGFETWIHVQNVGITHTKAILILWGDPSACLPQAAGPLKIECSGLIRPGSAWVWQGAYLPAAARSGIVYSVDTDLVQDAYDNWDVFADLVCECLFDRVTKDAGDFRRFDLAYQRGEFLDLLGPCELDFKRNDPQPLAVQVLRRGPGVPDPQVRVTAAYSGIPRDLEGLSDPISGGFAYYVPLVYGNRDGLNSWIQIQNSGQECTSIELYFKAQDDCLRTVIAQVRQLAPGETYSFDVSSVVSAGFQGSAWIGSSQPLGIVVDHLGRNLFMSYIGLPAELNETFDPGGASFTVGSQVNYGPLIYREQQGWDTLIQVQNLSSVANAKVKVYFLDVSGGVITTIVDWICPRGSQSFFLPAVSNLPGNYVGAARVESLDWWSPGDPPVPPPNVVSVAQLVKYKGPARAEPLEAIAYNLFPEGGAFDWQVGSDCLTLDPGTGQDQLVRGGLCSGVGRIGLPALLKRGGRLSTEMAVQNVVPQPGFTDFAIYLYDQNRLNDHVCQKLSEKQVDYINLDSWGYLSPNFEGSGVISATYWEHPAPDPAGGSGRNLVGLAAVVVQRSGATLGYDVEGDESAGVEAFPIRGPFRFARPDVACPGSP